MVLDNLIVAQLFEKFPPSYSLPIARTGRCTLSYVIYVYPAHKDIRNSSQILCNLHLGLSIMCFPFEYLVEILFAQICVQYGRAISPLVISSPWQYLKKSTNYGVPHYTNSSRSRLSPPPPSGTPEWQLSFPCIERNTKIWASAGSVVLFSPSDLLLRHSSDTCFGSADSIS